MKLTKKQKQAIELITGRIWSTWDSEAIAAFFAFTDKGLKVSVSPHAEADLIALLTAHNQHPITVEMWKVDFRNGTLHLADFLKDDYPKVYIRHAFDIYQKTMGFIPRIYTLIVRYQLS